jgi:hypothetical protein
LPYFSLSFSPQTSFPLTHNLKIVGSIPTVQCAQLSQVVDGTPVLHGDGVKRRDAGIIKPILYV